MNRRAHLGWLATALALAALPWSMKVRATDGLEADDDLAILRSLIGPVLASLEDPNVLEVWRNGDGSIWVDDRDRGVREIPHQIDEADMESVVAALGRLAGSTPTQPIGAFDDDVRGWSVAVAFPPVGRGTTLCVHKAKPI